MANLLRQVVTSAGMQPTLYVGSVVGGTIGAFGGASAGGFGVNISGTWVGQVNFAASFDGMKFIPVSLTPWPFGQPVNSTQANGQWYLPFGNYASFQVQVPALVSGSVQVTMASAVDGSWQDAFLVSTSKYVNQSAVGAQAQITIPAQANRAWRLRTCAYSVNATANWATSPALLIQDGSSATLWALDLPTTAGQFSIILPGDPQISGGPVGGVAAGGGVVTSLGNSLVVTLASPGGAVKSNLNCEVYAA